MSDVLILHLNYWRKRRLLDFVFISVYCLLGFCYWCYSNAVKRSTSLEIFTFPPFWSFGYYFMHLWCYRMPFFGILSMKMLITNCGFHVVRKSTKVNIWQFFPVMKTQNPWKYTTISSQYDEACSYCHSSRRHYYLIVIIVIQAFF